MITAPSTADKAHFVSCRKLVYPGVSIILRRFLFQVTEATFAFIENFLSISIWSKSITLVPDSILPIFCVAPVLYKTASIRLVFPAPPCEIKATFLIILVSIQHLQKTIFYKYLILSVIFAIYKCFLWFIRKKLFFYE